jgi:hypothetical protein
MCPPSVADGLVFSVSYEGKVYALKATNGDWVWESNLKFGPMGSLTVADGRVFVAAFEKGQGVFALDATDGTEMWNFKTKDNVQSTPVVVDGLVFFGSDDNKTYALNAEDGSGVWDFETGAKVQSSPAVADGIVFVTNTGGRLLARQVSDGSKVWSFGPPWSNGRGAAVTDGLVFFGSANENKVYALKTEARPASPNRFTLIMVNMLAYLGASIGFAMLAVATCGKKKLDASSGKTRGATAAAGATATPGASTTDTSTTVRRTTSRVLGTQLYDDTLPFVRGVALCAFAYPVFGLSYAVGYIGYLLQACQAFCKFNLPFYAMIIIAEVTPDACVCFCGYFGARKKNKCVIKCFIGISCLLLVLEGASVLLEAPDLFLYFTSYESSRQYAVAKARCHSSLGLIRDYETCMADENRTKLIDLFVVFPLACFLTGSSAKCGYDLLKAWNAAGSLVNNDMIGPDGAPVGQTIGAEGASIGPDNVPRSSPTDEESGREGNGERLESSMRYQ